MGFYKIFKKMKRLDNKIAIITGGARGLGEAAVRLFVQHGAKVAIWDMLPEGETLAAELIAQGYSVIFQKVNITQKNEVEKAKNEIIATWGRIDILINNAGITRDRSFAKMSDEEWQMVMDVNLNGVYNCTKAVIEGMISQNYGRIICTSSIVGVHGAFGQTNYAATKAAVIAMCRTWAKELAKFNITANAVAPGYIKTVMTDAVPEEVKANILAGIPAKRMGLPVEVAQCYLFLASDEAAYINGQVIGINGGMAS